MENNKLDLTAILESCKSLILEVGAFIKKASIHLSEISVKDKNHNNLVTKIDKESEQRLVEGLKKILPNSGFITEEKTVAQQKKDYVWIIDPLDGTKEFVNKNGQFTVNIGLTHNSVPVFWYCFGSSYRRNILWR